MPLDGIGEAVLSAVVGPRTRGIPLVETTAPTKAGNRTFPCCCPRSQGPSASIGAVCWAGQGLLHSTGGKIVLATDPVSFDALVQRPYTGRPGHTPVLGVP
jgi:hypothetical protein